MSQDSTKTHKPWDIGKNGCATSYFPHEKQFLLGAIERFPSLSEAFDACEKLYPAYRLHDVREKMTVYERQVWADFGVPAGQRETLAEHAGRMAMLACMYPKKNYDFNRTLDMIGVWGMPLAIVGEIPLHQMDRPQRHQLREMAARMVFDDRSCQNMKTLWKSLDSQSTPESKWVNDLDYIATALQARKYQEQALGTDMEILVDSCHRSLVTSEARAIWDICVGKAPVLQAPAYIELPPEPLRHVSGSSTRLAGSPIGLLREERPLVHVPASPS